MKINIHPQEKKVNYVVKTWPKARDVGSCLKSCRKLLKTWRTLSMVFSCLKSYRKLIGYFYFSLFELKVKKAIVTNNRPRGGGK